MVEPFTVPFFLFYNINHEHTLQVGDSRLLSALVAKRERNHCEQAIRSVLIQGRINRTGKASLQTSILSITCVIM